MTDQSENDSPTVAQPWWCLGTNVLRAHHAAANAGRRKKLAAGNTGNSLTSSRAVNLAPRFSPDGSCFLPNRQEMMGFHPSCPETELDSEGEEGAVRRREGATGTSQCLFATQSHGLTVPPAPRLSVSEEARAGSLSFAKAPDKKHKEPRNHIS